MNWRKPVIKILLRLTGSKIISNYNYIISLEKNTYGQNKKMQEEKLKKLLLHAYQNVPYYTKVLSESRVIENNKVYLNNFNKIPILTKDVLRKEFENLKSKDIEKRKIFLNTSGGSTGEPVKFIQDKKFYEWMVATKLYYFHLAGKELGEKELKLWGSDRDILEGTIGIKEKLMNFLYNRKFLNSFKMTEKNMYDYVEEINRIKPKVIWAYVESIAELSKFIREKGLQVYSPNSIISTAGTLSEEIRNLIEDTFKTKVYNQYGSREVGDIASECQNRKGMHIFEWNIYSEVIKEKIMITLLSNYSMPLIRYEIGDTGNMSTKKLECHVKTKILTKVTGRVTNHFILRDGTIIHGEYFSHMFYFKDWIKKFRITQKDYDNIICAIVKIKEPAKKEIKEIEISIKKIMGNQCRIKWEFVQNISASKSGKYIYTISELR